MANDSDPAHSVCLINQVFDVKIQIVRFFLTPNA